ncbi:MFS transporter [Thaumasiovibrio subtropicus]|uniref:MFS transporter n=1 Tax=Thaumasiovibrio subtropicus TaxID=1891207 RepID=UPI000B35A6FD|nr:MFS transporter [Thaumasiovibrio subtropicus]
MSHTLSTSERSGRQRLRTLFLLLASTMTVMAGATLAPALPGMANAFSHLPQAEFFVKLAMTLPGLAIAICAPLVGRLLDRSNKKPVLVSALLIYALSGVAGYFWQESMTAILFSRVCLGVAVAAIMVGCTTLASDYFAGPKLGQYMGLQAAFGGLGGVVFLALAGMIAEQHWSSVFFIYLLAALVLPGVMVWIDEPTKSDTDKQAIDSAPQINRRGILLCYTLASAEIFVLYSLTLQLPFMLPEMLSVQGDISATESGLWLAGFLLVMSLVSMGYGRLSQWLTIQRLHLLGWTVIGVGIALLSTASGYIVTSLSLGLAAMGLGMVRPNLIVWLFSFTPPSRRGEVIGGITTCFFAGQFATPFISEPIISFTNSYSAFIGGLGILLITVCVTVTLLHVFRSR